MSTEIFINVTPMETRVAFVENSILQEVYMERTLKHGIVGNIYKGQVIRVLPGMQAAFVDIGLDKAAFIHVAELTSREFDQPQEEDITKLLKEGQSLIVQVTKDPIGTKGARLTTQLSLPSHYLVYMPQTQHIGISLRIEDEIERERLKQLVNECIEEEAIIEGGFIIRTAAEGIAKSELLTDIRYLSKLWSQVKDHIDKAQASSLIYEDLPLNLRIVRDFMNPTIHKVYIDAQETYLKAEQFLQEFLPELSDRLQLYMNDPPLFDIYGIEQELQKAIERKVPLKSGGYLVIDNTEAMATIDVNTGGFVGHKNLEETIFKTNLEAATAIARQLRLRNLGGIIIIDFIDMELEEHRDQVLQTLQKELEKDHSKTNVLGFTELGLVQMTRKRTRENLDQTLCEPCFQCQGKGTLKTSETVCYEIFREIMRIARAYPTNRYLILANQKIVDRLLDEESNNVADLETLIGKTISFQVENLYTQDQYDVVPQ